MERYLDKDGKWAWKYDDEVVVKPNQVSEPIKKEEKPKKK